MSLTMIDLRLTRELKKSGAEYTSAMINPDHQPIELTLLESYVNTCKDAEHSTKIDKCELRVLRNYFQSLR
jgi:hypothetical protein